MTEVNIVSGVRRCGKGDFRTPKYGVGIANDDDSVAGYEA
jgi:hypothetical protein